jgi:hypothetical protein
MNSGEVPVTAGREAVPTRMFDPALQARLLFLKSLAY